MQKLSLCAILYALKINNGGGVGDDSVSIPNDYQCSHDGEVIDE
jgi:hypothetical protein